MKLLHAVLFSALATTALATNIVIGYPPANKKIHAGQNLTVQVIQPGGIQGPIVVGLAVGIYTCGQEPCPPPSRSLGSPLYYGPYYPVQHRTKPFVFPYENFTVVVPSYVTKGRAQLNVALAGLFGADDIPSWEMVNQTLIVV
ncbi:hypothetical protein APHAL10511_008485 [Amanita phalloides]|nr:hypothetical protein APHAL10511_008485 [Amanita phalloides]